MSSGVEQATSIAEEKAGLPAEQPTPARVNEHIHKQESPTGPARKGILSPALRRRLGGRLKRPATGAAVAGAVVLGAAAVLGAAEAAVAAGAAYVTYRILNRQRQASRQASAARV
jgi:hypothetical protein